MTARMVHVFHWFNNSHWFNDIIICMGDLSAMRTILSIQLTTHVFIVTCLKLISGCISYAKDAAAMVECEWNTYSGIHSKSYTPKPMNSVLAKSIHNAATFNLASRKSCEHVWCQGGESQKKLRHMDIIQNGTVHVFEKQIRKYNAPLHVICQ